MINRILAASMLFIAACDAPNQTPKAAREIQGQILTNLNALSVYKQCSRDTPQMPEAVWTPSKETLEKVERLILPKVRSALGGWKNWLGQTDLESFENVLPTLKREYVGVVRNDKKFIYVNLFQNYEIDDEPRTGPTIFCDGGHYFFGVEYDVVTQKIIHIAFNGVA